MKTSAGILLFRRRTSAAPQGDLFAGTVEGSGDPPGHPAGASSLEAPIADRFQVLLVHPGGPFWTKKDAGAWSIPKGEYESGDDPLAAARREFAEELGVDLPAGDLIPLGDIKQKGGKVITAWAVQGDLDAAAARSNTFRMEYPPRSGRFQDFPEIDRAEWFGIPEARAKINPAQAEFLDRLLEVSASR